MRTHNDMPTVQLDLSVVNSTLCGYNTNTHRERAYMSFADCMIKFNVYQLIRAIYSDILTDNNFLVCVIVAIAYHTITPNRRQTANTPLIGLLTFRFLAR